MSDTLDLSRCRVFLVDDEKSNIDALVETLQEGKTRRSGCGHDRDGRAGELERDYLMFPAAASPLAPGG